MQHINIYFFSVRIFKTDKHKIWEVLTIFQNFTKVFRFYEDDKWNFKVYIHYEEYNLKAGYLRPLSSWLVLIVLASQRVTTPFLSLITARVSPSLSQPIPVHILLNEGFFL
jgi:hypothetical protein